MQQLTPSVYVVKTGEVVTIIATPIKIAPEMVLASTEGQTLPNIDGATPTFQFGITKPPNSAQIAQILCNFPTLPGDDTEGRMCRLRVQGSKGGDFTGPTIKESDSLHVISLNFLVDSEQEHLSSIAAVVESSASKGKARTKKKPGSAKKR